MRSIVLVILALVGAVDAAAEQPTLTVYTYDSFAAEWGPGPKVKAAFEKDCGCRLEFVALEDGVALLSRLRLEGADTKADVVLGLDTNLIVEAAATGLFAEHGVSLAGLDLPIPWTDRYFVPFDYGYFAVVYDRTRVQPPASLDELVNGDPAEKILIQDPRTSTPGLGLLLWMRKVYGEGAGDAWARLRPRILTVSKGWSEAYGLFVAGEAPMVLSYTTSPAYHVIAENETRYAAASFAEGHYLQVEVAGRVAVSQQPDLAARFLAFMVAPAFQEHIPTNNWMYPVAKLPGGLPPAFDDLVRPVKALLFQPAEVAASRKRWVDEWLAAMSR